MDHSRAIKNERVILKALAEIGQSKVAAMIDMHESTVSKAKDNVQTFSRILAASHLKVVPDSVRCFDPEYVESLLHIVREHLREQAQIKTLEWD